MKFLRRIQKSGKPAGRSAAALAATFLLMAVSASFLGGCQAKKPGEETDTAAAALSTSQASPLSSEAADSQKGNCFPLENSIALLTYAGPGESGQADAVWSGITRYAKEKEIEAEKKESQGAAAPESLKETVSEAASGFATVVCLEEVFTDVVLDLASGYPDTRFILFSGGESLPEHENVWALLYKEEQAGFLAGYAAVCEGAGNLGFIGRIDEPASVNYGYGFLQGADAAALEMEREISVRYAYTRPLIDSRPGPNAAKLAEDWFQSGTAVIFAEGEENAAAVIQAAEENGGLVIGSDFDRAEASPAVLTSAAKDPDKAIYTFLRQMDGGELAGGACYRRGTEGNAVGLPVITSRFAEFTPAEYEMIYKGIQVGDYPVASQMTEDGELLEISDLNLTNTEVHLAE